MSEYFWAKTTAEGKPGKSVLSHMCDVRAVADILLEGKASFLQLQQVERNIFSYFAGLHDIGKISPGFQSKCLGWLQQNNLINIAKNYAWDATYESDHSKVTQHTIQTILQKGKMQTASAELWGALVGAHHGRFHKLGIIPKGCKPDDEWAKRREKTIDDFLGSINLPDFQIDNSWPLAWWLAGLVSVADWIGSDEDYFYPEIETTPNESANIAVTAFKAIGFDGIKVRQNLSFGDIFKNKENQPFIPNDLQAKAGDFISEPGLYVIEAPMGMGKTEAALWCSYKLMCEGKASGIYFALPTQTTSNRIHERVQNFLKNISDEPVDARLIHAGSWLLDQTVVPSFCAATASEKESVQDAKDWFASKKRALLAPFGVGTVDQALMSVIAVKHFFVRQFALSGKVVILDEVHSYDLYTGTLIKTLCEKLLPLGCTIIVLSATLTQEGKSRFIGIAKEENQENYPLITGRNTNQNEIEYVPVERTETAKVSARFENEISALSTAIKKAENGACILWVSDTVNRSQEIYRRAEQIADNKVELGLLHARFPVFRRQELEDYWMEKLGKDGKKRNGCILFSTQVVEQSVDLDADFMVSELAPTDMLFQRMGRLWRHPRSGRPCKKREFYIISENKSLDELKNVSADKIKKMLGSKAWVYAPYVLLRSLELWMGMNVVNLPDDIRGLLEKTYELRGDDPAGWQKLAEEIEGEEFAQKNSAEFEANVWNPLLMDEEGMAKTRVNDYPTTQMILIKEKQKNNIVLLNGEIAVLRDDMYSLSAARSTHRNIVKIPAYCFRSKQVNAGISALVRGDWQLGVVDNNGNVINKNLKDEYKFRYTPEKGVEIMRNKGKDSGVNNEPCD
ncbi:MAG: CRISPR-associated helicase Cas3' [Planctomycetes bacterium]|nr:CRISPR-associated helicase Cas3' [Planctomycetota bacterium]